MNTVLVTWQEVEYRTYNGKPFGYKTGHAKRFNRKELRLFFDAIQANPNAYNDVRIYDVNGKRHMAKIPRGE